MDVVKFYAGVGSRETPDDILALMTAAAEKLNADGWTLRSGHAPGADQAFEKGAHGNAHIFLPWAGFERDVPVNGSFWNQPNPRAFEVAAQHHPAWGRLGHGARALHARNVHQVLGYDLQTLARFVLCWTPGGNAGGGTGQAIRLANTYGVEVIDLAHPRCEERIRRYAA